MSCTGAVAFVEATTSDGSVARIACCEDTPQEFLSTRRYNNQFGRHKASTVPGEYGRLIPASVGVALPPKTGFNGVARTVLTTSTAGGGGGGPAGSSSAFPSGTASLNDF